MNKLVLFRPEKLNPPRKGEQYYDRLQLKPGTNHLSEVELAKLLAHPDYEQHRIWGAIEPVEPKAKIENKVPTEGETGLDKLSDVAAQKVIEQTFDVAVLETWLKSEKRKVLINAINRRVTELKKGEA
ncbi:hypothetical protein NIES2135_26500 [Leptolyngbya boryana NIES-2135]|jgi:hypothetical protein|uniref:Uncharacterized protein n=1 Tax=Leptolyngbya boryana NIES-2135 TaxID=1973484 RepID=A0A1Z4JGE0_LEPBY|nr:MULTISPECIES: hypothetical protein [Leptolyngbya]BAY55826.1 hypothetical protein NIES2135_26500 [Leptolyngbya boryana NIES-2135]MBD2368868.1 hypothetical protein [Leptolyngbya sp. FACHB-161]MBD2375264.1 hypothetical protein [Leptolyngbya sp. FACHB-238]MBD2399682.1 hypothetical protein [Leptolyngbya sp. FACHB-239]MBD2405888.1 hypothetical protein [Leptolyngbya sp. FACHB-402]